MGLDNKYPYTDFHEFNLDWLLEKVKGIDDRFVAIEDAVAALQENLDIQTGRIDAALDAITFIQNHYPAMIASQYDENRQYDPGEIAIYDNELYIALPGETPGPWDGNYWNKTSLGDELGTIIIKVNDIILPDLTNINNVLAEYGTLFDDIVETYVPGSTYVKNQMVKYEDHIYRVMVASTSNPPTDLTDWDPETLANILTDVLNIPAISYEDFPVKELELIGNEIILDDAVQGYPEKLNIIIDCPQSGTGTPSTLNIRNFTPVSSFTLHTADDKINPQISADYPVTFDEPIAKSTYNFNTGNNQIIKKIIELDGSEPWAELSPGKFYVVALEINEAALVPNDTEYECNMYMFKGNGSNASSSVTTDHSLYGQRSFGRFWVYDSDFANDLEGFTTFLSNNHLQVKYPLTTTIDESYPVHKVQILTGKNAIWTDYGIELSYHYAAKYPDYTPDDRVVVIGTYSGKRVLQINHFKQNVSLDGSLKSYNILPPNAILINAWAYGKGNDDGSMANMNIWWSTTAGDLCFMASSWASNTAADIWMYAQYVE